MIAVLFQDQKRIHTDTIAVFDNEDSYEACEPALRVYAQNANCIMVTSHDNLDLNKVIDSYEQ